MSRRFLIAGAAALALSACVSVLPAGKPVTLYRFEAQEAPAPGAAPSAAPTNLVLSGVVLPAASAGDGLLTVTGEEAAYVAGARWVSPAALLMQAAAQRVFAERAPGLRLLRRDQPAGASGALLLEVTAFEARYPAPGAAPVVRVALHAVLSRPDGTFAAERRFAVDQPAAENRLAAIVPAYDAATTRVLADAAAWTAAAAAALPPPRPAEAVRTTTTATSTTGGG